ncbi:hypothetical protein [Tateyamaria sp. SN3-11]|uniref:hypothetical protein n=1 Tax=Tateyamaria sp. SN3-11 TaxID=3092147 RepID=UPI0039EB40E1
MSEWGPFVLHHDLSEITLYFGLPLLIVWAVWLVATFRLQKSMQTGWWSESRMKLVPKFSQAYRRRQFFYTIAFIVAQFGVFFSAAALLRSEP